MAPYRGTVIGSKSVKLDFDFIEKFFLRTRRLMDYLGIDISSMGELTRRCNRAAWVGMSPN